MATLDRYRLSSFTVDVQDAAVLASLRNGAKRQSYAIANAINTTLLAVQASVPKHLRKQGFVIRKPKFFFGGRGMRGGVANYISDFANAKRGKIWGRIVAGLQQPGGDGDFLFEGNVRYFLGGEETPSLEWSSVEDWAMGSYYFEQPNRTDEGGIMSHDTYVGSPTKISAYKNHGKHPIKFTNGIRCTVPQYSSYGPATFNWTTFYYEDTASA